MLVQAGTICRVVAMLRPRLLEKVPTHSPSTGSLGTHWPLASAASGDTKIFRRNSQMFLQTRMPTPTPKAVWGKK